MKQELVSNLTGNEILEENIYNQLGALILSKGKRLSANMKKRLIENGITYVYISDEKDNKPEIDAKEAEPEIKAKEKIIKLKKDTLSRLPVIFNELLNNNGKAVYELMSIADEFSENIKQPDIINNNLYGIDIYDDYTYMHSIDTAIMSVLLGKAIDSNLKFIRTLALSAILCDIGNIKISSSLINKKGRLTTEEFNIIMQHPKLGFDILIKLGIKDKELLYGVLQHHERYNGKGYPLGLSGNEISYISKIISICDVYTAISSDRSYRKRFSPQEAYNYIIKGAGISFDPFIVSKFKENFPIYPVGCIVKLSNGITGSVLRQNKDFWDKPVILAGEKDSVGNGLNYEIDLLTETKLTIIEAVSLG